MISPKVPVKIVEAQSGKDLHGELLSRAQEMEVGGGE